MSKELYDRIGALRGEIDRAEGAQREVLIDTLESAVMALEARGTPVPGWAKSRIAARREAEMEDRFDNMPI
ncbi:hypothetical protein [Ponticoccus alexandrii]|uniref:Uncharacterized protein n=1 Tax=Ponticoccus alexandrii TaxID=1943633 RepID=A0ABX7FC50_9RHOB|nr:hypothetical protein [Ponticoccus alexandrii]ETA53839.1 hypothetical protein P279_01095 [Rhodobacteraceae bacterium PD-2]QRF67283.1 hypothetical protein GQA70_13780 [Ponticoccus alexandrii]